MEKQYRLLVWLLLGLLIFSFLGFYKTYFGLFPDFRQTSGVVHFHVLSILSWFALLFLQAWLARQRRFGLHRKIGRLSYVLVPLIVLGFVLVTNHGQIRHKSPDLLGATLFDGGLFLLFYALAMVHRKNPASHARYMILSTLPFINPGLGRFIGPELSLPVEFLLLLGLFLMAFFRKEPYRPYLFGLGSFILLLSGVIYVSVIDSALIESLWRIIWG